MTTINRLAAFDSGNSINTLLGTSNNMSTNAQNKQNLFDILTNQYGTNIAPELSSGLQNYITTLKTSGSSLDNLLRETMGRGSGNTIYNQTRVTSSDEDVISVDPESFTATAGRGLKDTTMTVEQIAQAQVNQGTALAERGLSIGTGHKSMIITDSDGKEHTFSVNPTILQNDRNIQNQLADKINASNIGITAKVEIDSETNASSLVLTANSTGTDAAFSVSGDLADALGISNATTQAQNAVYTVNGNERTSQSNDIEVNGVAMTLRKASTEDISFTERNDNSNLIKAAKEIVGHFNKIREAAESFSSDNRAERLFNSISTLARTYSGSLSRSGININEDGYLEIDEDRLNAAAENGDLQRLLGRGNNGSSVGFASRLQRLASNVSDNPMNHLDLNSRLEYNDSMNQSSAFNSSNLSTARFVTRLNNYYNVGMLFDSMF